MEFRICFSIAKYENEIFSLFETNSEFIQPFCLSEVHFHQSGPLTLKLVKTMLKPFSLFRFISSIESLFKG